MKRHVGKQAVKFLAVLLTLTVAIATVGCQNTTPAATVTKQQETTASTEAPTTAEETTKLTFEDEITIDMYSGSCNYQGILAGWLGKAVKDEFNMKINIIAPNISGQAVFQTRSAAGNLGDIILTKNNVLTDTVKAGLLMDITDLLAEYGGHLKDYSAGIKSIQNYLETDRVYAIPQAMSTLSPTAPLPDIEGAMSCTQSGGAVYLRYDIYQAVGSPEMSTMEDLLPVMKQMQEQYPASISGKPVYGFSLFKDWDGPAMKAIWESFPTMYGYQFAPGATTVLTYGDPTTHKTQTLDQDDGLYYRTLKFYFQANQMGLVDPDSPSQNWDTVCSKVKDGQVLFYWWPWASMSQFNDKTKGNEDPPVGFEFVPIADMKYYDAGYNPLGQWNSIVAIGSKAQDPERMMAFIDWCSSPEGVELIINGPKGLTWDIQDGEPVLTDFGKKAHLDNTIQVPEEYGGGTVKENTNSSYNYLATGIFLDEIDPLTNTPYRMASWPSFKKDAATALDLAWKEAYGAEDMLDYIQKHDMLAVAPGNSYNAPVDSGDIKNQRAQCSKIVADTSWRMVFAKDEAEFETLWTDMKEQILGLGWEDVVAVDMQNSKDYNVACMDTINNSK